MAPQHVATPLTDELFRRCAHQHRAHVAGEEHQPVLQREQERALTGEKRLGAVRRRGGWGDSHGVELRDPLDLRDPRRWQQDAALHRQLRGRYYPLSAAVDDVARHTVRASSVIENLNSRLRSYFFLRRHLGPDYLALLQFFLNHRRFLRSEHPERVGKSPAELLSGQSHPHWLQMLGFTLFSRN